MAAQQPNVSGTIVAAYRDVARALGDMPLKFVIALIIALVAAFVPHWDDSEPTLVGIGFSLIPSAVLSLLYTPFLIALHRYIILGEITRGYVIDIQSPRFMAFVTYSVLFFAVLQIPSLIGLFLPKMSSLVVWVIILVLCLRFVLIFPAIAVDAPQASLASATADARGHLWRVFLIIVLIGLPIDVALLVAIMVDPAFGTTPYQMSTYVKVLTSLVSPASQALLIAAASHLYLQLADRLRV